MIIIRALSQPISFCILSKCIDLISMTVISDMLHTICINCAKPHVVVGAPGIEEINCYVRSAHFGSNSSIGTISHIDCPVLLWSVAD